MTTSTSQGRRVPFFLGLFVFLFFIALSLFAELPTRFPNSQIPKFVYAAACWRAASCASAISPASKLVL